MNYKLNIAQPCSYKQDGNRVIVKPNTYKPFIIFEELLVSSNFQTCVLFHTLETPISLFNEVWKAVDNVESWHPYEYYLVAYDVGISDVFKLIKDKAVWPDFRDPKTGVSKFLPAFGDNEPERSEKYVTYNDTHVILGNKPHSVKLLKRKDLK